MRFSGQKIVVIFARMKYDTTQLGSAHLIRRSLDNFPRSIHKNVASLGCLAIVVFQERYAVAKWLARYITKNGDVVTLHQTAGYS